jgi:hypothetical protein
MLLFIFGPLLRCFTRPADMHMYGAAIGDVEAKQGGRLIVENSSLVDELHWAIL